MIIKGLVEEDFVNYKYPSMVILMPHCNWKCGSDLCHNLPCAKAPDILIQPQTIVKRYLNNPIPKALVFSGLEPFMDFEEVLSMIEAFRKVSKDTIIIYSGYTEEELEKQIEEELRHKYKNIIIKFGRYIPGQMSHIDPILGVELASDNQYAKQIS